jgi:hypothetical protein
MREIHFSMLLHFIGIGTVFTTLLAGWILTAQYARTSDYHVKNQILVLLRPIGLLSPAGILILLLSGIWNMSILHYSISSAGWLSAKLVLFAVAAVSGIMSGVLGPQRKKLVSALAEGKAAEGAEKRVAAYDRLQRLFYIVQAFLILTILTLTLVKPQL